MSWTVQESPPAIDLTAQGTLDWSHWGDHLDGSPVHKATGGSLVGTFTGANVACNDNSGSGWPILASWSDGTPEGSGGPTNLHRRFYGTNGLTVSLGVACDGKQHVLGVDLGGWSSQAQFEAGLDNITLTPPIKDVHGNPGDYYALRYLVTYVCPVGTRVFVKWVATNLPGPTPTATSCGGSDMILSSAWLR
jgi:hypothetical protein